MERQEISRFSEVWHRFFSGKASYGELVMNANINIMILGSVAASVDAGELDNIRKEVGEDKWREFLEEILFEGELLLSIVEDRFHFQHKKKVIEGIKKNLKMISEQQKKERVDV